jgi:hypothetical protein
MPADTVGAAGVSLQRIVLSKALVLLASAMLLAYLFAVLFQMFILWGKGFALSETLPNALVSAELSWFLLPAFCAAVGAIVGAFVGRQLSVAAFLTGIALTYQCLSSQLWVAILFSIPAALIAFSPLFSSHFVLGKNNV